VGRNPTLSPSKITTYLACPVRYRWTYLDDRGKRYMRAKSYYSFGNTLHKVLERFHDADDAGVTTTLEAAAAYEESWLDAGFANAEEMSEAYGEGLVIIERHIEEEAKRTVTSHTLFVEKTLKFDYDEFRLLGRIDRLDEREDGSLEIIDYKSGRETVTEEDVASDIAMACYQLLLSKAYPDRKIFATIMALRSGASASASMSAVDLEEFEADIYKLGCEIVSSPEELLERTPVLKRLCQDCDFVPLCKKHPEFAESMAARG